MKIWCYVVRTALHGPLSTKERADIQFEESLLQT